MVLLGGIGEAIIVKWIGGHAASFLGAHLAHVGTATATKIAYTGAHNAILTAANAPNTLAALGSAGKSAWDVRSAYDKEKEKMDDAADRLGRMRLAAEPKRVPTSYLDTVAPRHKDGLVNTLGYIMAMAAAAMWYASKEHYDMFGSVKTSLEELEPCGYGGCDCRDYEGLEENPADQFQPVPCLECGHSGAHHLSPDKDEDNEEEGEKLTTGDILRQARGQTEFGWLFREIMAALYPGLEIRDGTGKAKTEVEEITPCASQGCFCWDFELQGDVPRRGWRNPLNDPMCDCGHSYGGHDRNWRAYEENDAVWMDVLVTTMLTSIVIGQQREEEEAGACP